MDNYQEKTSSIDVPKNTGVDGFLKTLKRILLLPRVQKISIDAKGKVSYTRYVREDEPETPPSVDYASLAPFNIIRNGNLEELTYPVRTPATNVVALMFNKIASEGLIPIAFAVGSDSEFWRWHASTAGVQLSKAGSAYGLQIYSDERLPDHSLVIGASYVRGGFADCHRFFLVTMGRETTPPETSVSIL